MLQNLIILIFLKIILIAFVQCSSPKYMSMPKPNFQVFENGGITIWIEDKPGTKEFSFYGSINREYKGTEQKGKDIFLTTVQKTNNKWAVHDKDVTLELGDVIYFMYFVRYEDVGFIKDDQRWEVDAIYDENGNVKIKKPQEEDERDCERSVTRHLGKNPCRNKLIFYDDFTTETVAKKRWQIEKQIAQTPDFEFVAYDERNAFIANKKLVICPTATKDEEYVENGKIDFGDDCTQRRNSPACSRIARSFLILPPVNSSRLLSAPYFTFRYGKVEFRAKFPEGDWIYPELYLIPKSKDPSEKIQRILLAFAPGNEHLQHNDEDISSKRLKVGYFKYKSKIEEEFVPLSQPIASLENRQGWNKKFHTFTVTWEPGRIDFQVDYELLGVMSISNDPDLSESPNNEFYIAFGVGVGGNTFFPENTKTKQYEKPWKNGDKKAMLHFWQQIGDWLPTWQICTKGKVSKTAKDINCPAALQIDYVKVWAL